MELEIYFLKNIMKNKIVLNIIKFKEEINQIFKIIMKY